MIQAGLKKQGTSQIDNVIYNILLSLAFLECMGGPLGCFSHRPSEIRWQGCGRWGRGVLRLSIFPSTLRALVRGGYPGQTQA